MSRNGVTGPGGSLLQPYRLDRFLLNLGSSTSPAAGHTVFSFTDSSRHPVQPSQYTLLSGTAPPHPAPGVCHVPGVAGDDVDVQVHHRLLGGGADVVAVGVEAFVEEDFCLPDEGEEGGEFRVEEVRDVAVGDEEEVAGADGVPVIAGVAEVVLRGRSRPQGVAERAGQRAHASYPRTWIK